MDANIKSKENSVVKFTFKVSPESFEEGLKYAYNKNKGQIAIPGFRKGKVPRKVIEANYGAQIFFDDAVNYCLNQEYDKVIDELKLDVVAKPEVDVPECSKENGITFDVTVTVKPDVKLGKYKGLEVEKAEIEVSDEEVDTEIKKTQEQNAREIEVTDRAARLGDIVTISYKGTIDGVAFDGGSSDGFDLTLGSHSFIDTFEDQIVGHNIGDAFDVNVTFPTEYHDNDVAGKAAVFAVELKAMKAKELPEVNDEFAQDVSEFDTLDEYKADIKAKLTETKTAQAKDKKSDQLIEAVVKGTEMEIPAIMFENRIDTMVTEFSNNISRQGISLDVYLQYTGTSQEKLRDSFRESAEKSVKARLVLEQIVKDENITVSEEEVDDRIKEIGKSYGIDEEKILQIIQGRDREGIKDDMRVQKALDLLDETCVEIEK